MKSPRWVIFYLTPDELIEGVQDYLKDIGNIEFTGLSRHANGDVMVIARNEVGDLIDRREQQDIVRAVVRGLLGVNPEYIEIPRSEDEDPDIEVYVEYYAFESAKLTGRR